jgi:hypothetical protein
MKDEESWFDKEEEEGEEEGELETADMEEEDFLGDDLAEEGEEFGLGDESTFDDLDLLQESELRELCKYLGIDTKGTKEEIIARIRDY